MVGATYASPAYAEPGRGACHEREHAEDQGCPAECLHGLELATEGYGRLTDAQAALPDRVE